MGTNLLWVYGLLATGLGASLLLFLSLKREIQRARARMEKGLAEKKAETPEPVLIPAQPRSGININRRVHALRMLRRGEDVAHVAAALGVPRREIELLVRVSRTPALSS
jgi:hypothetical protein